MRDRERESGAILIGMLVMVTVVAGLATLLLTRGHQNRSAAVADLEAERLTLIAEAGLNYHLVQMQVDALSAVRDTGGFTWNASTSEFDSGSLQLQTSGGDNARSFQLHVQYRLAGAAVTFADRASPVEDWDEIRVRSVASSTRARRTVTAHYESRGYQIGGAIVSDMTPTDPIDLGDDGKGRDNALLGHVVLQGYADDNTIHVHGDIMANGSIAYSDPDDGVVLLDSSNVGTYLGSFSGSFRDSLAGTSHEIPDLTTIGSAEQLFDFDRYEAAAAAGAGAVYPHVKGFEAAMEAANDSGVPLQGIIVVKINPNSSNNYDFEEPINIRGTFLLRFTDGTDPLYKLMITTGGMLQINPADLTGIDPTDSSTYTSGYPPTLATAKNPVNVDISPTYDNFTADEDLPAMMYNNSILDIHDPCNICGVVYGASLLEVENKSGPYQYFNGAVYGGGGVWFASSEEDDEPTMIRFDPNAVDALETISVGGDTLVRTSYTVSR